MKWNRWKIECFEFTSKKCELLWINHYPFRWMCVVNELINFALTRSCYAEIKRAE
jgi:hypothetical protein